MQLRGAVCSFKAERKQNQKNVFSLSETSTSKVSQLFHLQRISPNRPGTQARVGVGSSTSSLKPGASKSLLLSGLPGEEKQREGGRDDTINNYYRLSTVPSVSHVSSP